MGKVMSAQCWSGLLLLLVTVVIGVTQQPINCAAESVLIELAQTRCAIAENNDASALSLDDVAPLMLRQVAAAIEPAVVAAASGTSEFPLRQTGYGNGGNKGDLHNMLNLSTYFELSEEQQQKQVMFGFDLIPPGQLTAQAAIPAEVLRLQATHLTSVGGRGSGIGFHAHDKAFLSLLSGSKLWFLVPPDVALSTAQQLLFS